MNSLILFKFWIWISPAKPETDARNLRQPADEPLPTSVKQLASVLLSPSAAPSKRCLEHRLHAVVLFTRTQRSKLYKFMSEKNWNCYCVCTSYVRRLFRFGVLFCASAPRSRGSTLRVVFWLLFFGGDCVWISCLD